MRLLTFTAIVWLAILGSNALFARFLGLSVDQWLSWVGGFALVGGLTAWWMAQDIASWGVNVKSLDYFSDKKIAEEVTQSVASIANRIGLKIPPDIAFFDSSDINAFAVGRTKNKMLLAVSSALLLNGSSQDRDVMISYQLFRIRSGDAAFWPLIQGQINVFSLFPARMLALLLGTALRTAEEETPSDPPEAILGGLLEIILTPLGSILARYASRLSHEKAERQVYALLGREQTLAAIQFFEENAKKQLHRDKFSGPMMTTAKVSKFFWIFSYHPTFAKRRSLLKAHS